MSALSRLLSVPQFSPRRAPEPSLPRPEALRSPAAGVSFPSPQPAPGSSPGSAARAPGASRSGKREGKGESSGLAERRPARECVPAGARPTRDGATHGARVTPRPDSHTHSHSHPRFFLFRARRTFTSG